MRRLELRRSLDSRYSTSDFKKETNGMQNTSEHMRISICLYMTPRVSGRFLWVRNPIHTISQSLKFEKTYGFEKSKFARKRLRKPVGRSGGAQPPQGISAQGILWGVFLLGYGPGCNIHAPFLLRGKEGILTLGISREPWPGSLTGLTKIDNTIQFRKNKTINSQHNFDAN